MKLSSSLFTNPDWHWHSYWVVFLACPIMSRHLSVLTLLGNLQLLSTSTSFSSGLVLFPNSYRHETLWVKFSVGKKKKTKSTLNKGKVMLFSSSALWNSTNTTTWNESCLLNIKLAECTWHKNWHFSEGKKIYTVYIYTCMLIKGSRSWQLIKSALPRHNAQALSCLVIDSVYKLRKF